jgi:hypothetical protein
VLSTLGNFDAAIERCREALPIIEKLTKQGPRANELYGKSLNNWQALCCNLNTLQKVF